MSLDVIGLFPVPVSKCPFGRALFESEMTAVLAQQTRQNQSNACSTNSEVLNIPELTDIKQFIDLSLQEYLHKVYTPQYTVRLEVTQSWFNYTGVNQHHHMHRHANSFVSGVFYIQTNETDGRIVFHREPTRELQIASAHEHLFNAKSWWVDVGVGELLLFPSYLAHSVNEVTGSKPRISLAFNTFPVGQIGRPDSLSSLVLK